MPILYKTLLVIYHKEIKLAQISNQLLELKETFMISQINRSNSTYLLSQQVDLSNRKINNYQMQGFKCLVITLAQLLQLRDLQLLSDKIY